MSRQSTSLPVAHAPGAERARPAIPAEAEAAALADPAARRGRPAGLRAAWRARTGPGALARDAGMATAEYAIVTLAAAGFGGLLLLLLRSDEVRGLLAGLVRSALTP